MRAGAASITGQGHTQAHTQGQGARGWWPVCLAVVLSLLAALPVVVARYPQMSDYPAHLARYHVMLDAGRSPYLAKWYSFEWAWTGNLGVDILIRPFAALFGLEPGGRIIVALIAVLSGLGLVAVEWALRRRVSIGTLLAMTTIWSPMLLMGLINYGLGQMLALWVFALWVWMDRHPAARHWRPTAMAPLGLVTWLCHMSAWGVLGIMVLGYEISQRRHWRALFAPWPLALPVLAMALGHTTSADMSYGTSVWAYKRGIWLMGMRDSAYMFDSISLRIVGLAVFSALVMRRFDWRLGLAGFGLVVASLVVPRHISGGDFADFRLVSSALMVLCMAIDWPLPGFALPLAASFYLARLVVTTLSWQADSDETAHILTALDHVPMGANVASAVLIGRSDWQIDHFGHIGTYVVVRRDGLSNANFAVAHIHMLHLRHDGYVDPSHRLILRDDQPVDLAHFEPARGADYLWYVGRREPSRLPAGAVVVWRWQHNLLLRLAPAPSA